MIPTPNWDEACTLLENGVERQGSLADLVLAATQAEIEDRPEYLIVSGSLGELDNEQIEGLRRRPDFPGLS